MNSEHDQGMPQSHIGWSPLILIGDYLVTLLRPSFVDHLCHLWLMFVMRSRLFIAALWSLAGEELTSWLSFVMFNYVCHFPMWYPGTVVVLDCIDS